MMDAARYASAIDREQLHYEARHLAHTLWMMFQSGSTENLILNLERCEAGAHLAWQLVEHTRRLCRDFEAEGTEGAP